MKFLLKIFIYILIFFISLFVFLPKEKIYNLAEKKLILQNIIISNEVRKEKTFSLDLNDIEIYYNEINTAIIKEAKINTYLFLSSIEITDIRVSNSFRNILPNKIRNLELKHSILDFKKINIFSKGDFGEFEAEFLIFENKIIGELKPSYVMRTKYKNLLKQFKLREGRYYYEYKF